MHESSFTSIHDLTDSQIMDVLQLAEEFEQDRSSLFGPGKGPDHGFVVHGTEYPYQGIV